MEPTEHVYTQRAKHEYASITQTAFSDVEDNVDWLNMAGVSKPASPKRTGVPRLELSTLNPIADDDWYCVFSLGVQCLDSTEPRLSHDRANQSICR